MAPEIRSTTDKFFCHSGPFFALGPRKLKFWKNEKNTWRYYAFTHVYHKWQSYVVWFLIYGAWWTEFFVILDRFLHLYPPNNLKNQNFEKMEKLPGDIIILQMCTINSIWFLTYEAWQTEFFIILDCFLPFYLRVPVNFLKMFCHFLIHV